ncbi:hypothetical protein E2C01_060279 [Portunus trituberculatus]|uniref:Uncharacterized protein n=1 Tax=Portunus trituberculatus TaxID=210409 RepID=A0A5B7H8V2_PORTR|nr:hypothetical protein [Portunus trituberculatus]
MRLIASKACQASVISAAAVMQRGTPCGAKRVVKQRTFALHEPSSPRTQDWCEAISVAGRVVGSLVRGRVGCREGTVALFVTPSGDLARRPMEEEGHGTPVKAADDATPTVALG